DARVDEARYTLDARERDVRAAAGALRRTDQVVRRQRPERLAERRTADPELAGEHLLVREPRSRLQVAGDDERAQLLGDLLVLFQARPNSRLPAVEAGGRRRAPAPRGEDPAHRHALSPA